MLYRKKPDDQMEDLIFNAPFKLEKMVKTIFGFICHQNNEILFRMDHKIFPLCQRCIGLHSGFFISIFIIKLLNKSLSLKNKFLKGMVLISFTAAGLHWMMGYFSFIEPDSYSRFISGTITGFAFCLILYSGSLTIGKKKNKTILLSALMSTLAALLLYIITDLYTTLLVWVFLAVTFNTIIISLKLKSILIIFRFQKYHLLQERSIK